MTRGPLRSENFQFLESDDPLVVALGAQAERYFGDDPSIALIKLRHFGEVLAQKAAALLGLFTPPDGGQLDLLNRLRDAGDSMLRRAGRMGVGLRAIWPTAIAARAGLA